MSEQEVTGYWDTQKVCEFFGGISTRTLSRWQNTGKDPFPTASHTKLGSKSLYSIAKVLAWDERNKNK